MKKWETNGPLPGEPLEIHTLPLNDLKEHARNRNCPCRPEIRKMDNDFIHVIHMSWDGREIAEHHDIQ